MHCVHHFLSGVGTTSYGSTQSRSKFIICGPDTVYFSNDSSNFVLQSGWLIDVVGLVFEEWWLTDVDKTHIGIVITSMGCRILCTLNQYKSPFKLKITDIGGLYHTLYNTSHNLHSCFTPQEYQHTHWQIDWEMQIE